MAQGLEPAFTPGRPVWPVAGMVLAEPDDPDLAILRSAFQNGVREAPERYFPANRNGLITYTPVEPLGPKPAKTLERKWKLALLASCIFHVAVALFFIRATDEAVLMEGADFSGIALLGSPEDQVEAGEMSEPEDTVDVTMVTMLDAVPVETVDADPVPVDEAVTAESEKLKPVEETPAERVTEATIQPVQPTERTEAVTVERQTASQPELAEPEAIESKPAPAVTETAPEVLATDRPELVDDHNVVQKPAETQSAEPVEAAETAETAKAESVEPSKTQSAETATASAAEPAKLETSEATKAEAKPAPAKSAKEAQKKPAAGKKTAKPKAEEGKQVAEKAGAKPKKSGNKGRNEANTVRGQADGREKGDSKQTSRGGSKNGEVGNAAVSNYPGKVRSKLARVARSVRAKGRGEVVVAFAVGSNGGVRSARVTRSSGVASVDQAALQAIRKASPFPPIPANAGRSTWEFSIPLAFMR